MSTLLETCVATHGAEFSINLLGCINDGNEAVSVGGAIIEVNQRYLVQQNNISHPRNRSGLPFAVIYHPFLILFFRISATTFTCV